MITYSTGQARHITFIYVFLDGKRVGTINGPLDGKYWYKPIGGHRGEKFDTIAEVKASIEGRR